MLCSQIISPFLILAVQFLGTIIPLHIAAFLPQKNNVRFRMMDLLLSYGANPNIVDSDGNTPAHRAVTSFKLSVIDLEKIYLGMRPLPQGLNATEFKEQYDHIQTNLVTDVLSTLGHLSVYQANLGVLNRQNQTVLEYLNETMPKTCREKFGEIDQEYVQVMYKHFTAENPEFKIKSAFYKNLSFIENVKSNAVSGVENIVLKKTSNAANAYSRNISELDDIEQRNTSHVELAINKNSGCCAVM